MPPNLPFASPATNSPMHAGGMNDSMNKREYKRKKEGGEEGRPETTPYARTKNSVHLFFVSSNKDDSRQRLGGASAAEETTRSMCVRTLCLSLSNEGA